MIKKFGYNEPAKLGAKNKMINFGTASLTPPRFVRSVLGAALLLGAVQFSMLATVQAQSIEAALLKNAQKLLSEGNAKQAFVELAAQQGRLAGMVDFDYLLGVAALDSGKIDDAIIAFERVLAVNPRNAGAQMDLARAYFTAGSLDLAKSTFENLRQSNPPAGALITIDRYLAAIADRQRTKVRSVMAYGEASLGYDSNITGVPGDFTKAVESAFNLTGVSPTGNSIKRKAPFVGATLGIDLSKPLADGWAIVGQGEIKGRAYSKYSDFNSANAELRAGMMRSSDTSQLRLTANLGRLNQKGLAPGDPRPYNDRTTRGANGEYRYAANDKTMFGLGLGYSQIRFLSNNIEDINSATVSGSVTRTFDGVGQPMFNLGAFVTRDTAVRRLADNEADKSKRVNGVRAYGQYSVSPNTYLFSALGYTARRDSTAFARATQVEYGRDKTTDLSMGAHWRFQSKCALKAQWIYARNSSNVAIYDYGRNEISSNIRCDFE
jgi:outer membrane protein